MSFGLADALVLRAGIDTRPAEAGLKRFTASAAKYGAALGAALSVGGIGAAIGGLVKSTFAASAEFETLAGRLEVLTGSSETARDRLEDLAVLAERTPFELPGIVQAETTLRGFGADAERVLVGVLDVAAATGGELNQVAIDVGKAWSVGATGLESDIGRVLRKQIELQEGVDASKMSLEDFREALVRNLDEGIFAGGAARLASTWTGLISTLSDTWTGFLRKVGEGGDLFVRVREVLVEILDVMAANRDEVNALADAIGGGLYDAFKGLVYLGAAFATGLQGIRVTLGFIQIGALSLGIAINDAIIEPLQQASILAAEGLGLTELAARWRTLQTSTMGLADQARAAREATAGLVTEILSAPTPLQAVEAAFQRIEERAANASGFMRDTGTDKDKGGGDGTGDELTFLPNASGVEVEEEIDWLARYTAARDVLLQQAHDAEMQRIADEREARKGSLIDYLSAASNTFGAIGRLAEATADESKDAHKGWAITSILIDSLAAGIRAFAELGPIGGAVAGVGIAADAAAAIAEIRKLHQGGIVMTSRAPDEYDEGPVRRLGAEATLNTQATRALGSEGVNALNSGRAIGPTVVELRVGRAVQRVLIGDDIRAGGQIPAYVGAASRSGRRDAGMSGTRAVA